MSDSSPDSELDPFVPYVRLARDFQALAEQEIAFNKDFEYRRKTLSERGEQAREARTREWENWDRQLRQEEHHLRQQLQQKTRRRGDRITRTAHQARESLVARLEEETGHHRYEWQKGVLETNRHHESQLQAQTEWKETHDLEHEARRQQLTLELEETELAFGGFPHWKRQLQACLENPGLPGGLPPEAAVQESQKALETHMRLRKQWLWRPLPALYRYVHFWVWLVLILVASAAATPFLKYLGRPTLPPGQMFLLGGGLFMACCLGYLLARKTCQVHARALMDSARRLAEAVQGAGQAGNQFHLDQTTSIHQQQQETLARLDQDWKEAKARVEHHHEEQIQDLARRETRASQRLARLEASRLKELTQEIEQRAREGRQALEEDLETLDVELQADQTNIRHQEESRHQELKLLAEALREQQATLLEQAREDEGLHPDWTASCWEHWQAPTAYPNRIRIARLEVRLDELAGKLPKSADLQPSEPWHFSLPLCVDLSVHGGVWIQSEGSADPSVTGAFNQLALRLLAHAPAGKLQLHLLDPVGLGQGFAALTHLGDHGNLLLSGRIWTQSDHMDGELAKLGEHMEKVIQMYLRNDFANLAEYNLSAGDVGEKYHFLIAADFPSQFGENAARRLHSLTTSGARCGVFHAVHQNTRLAMPAGVSVEEMQRRSLRLHAVKGRLLPEGSHPPGIRILPDPMPSPEWLSRFIRQVGEQHLQGSVVRVPFSHIAPTPDEYWKSQAGQGFRVPVGRTGASKHQWFALGEGTRQHALIAGKTGSGKSTLFHVLITNLARWYSPAEVEFYLVDFKKGVEFQCYAARRLPHARVVAIESDREFGLSVLQRLDDELRLRGERFRAIGVQDLSAFRSASGETLPRTILLIDEFQELFVEEDRIAQEASLLLDRVVRQGRAFGIHVILGSQTLGGAYTLARATLGQMVVRVALQCNESDAYLIMDDTNAAPRMLSRPGEGIYNDQAGALEGNSPFQTAWLDDKERDLELTRITEHASHHTQGLSVPVIFEGNAPALISDNPDLPRLLEACVGTPAPSPLVWLGAPNAIKGPTQVRFRRQSGDHLLLVGQREEPLLAMMGLALIPLAVPFAQGRARIHFLEAGPEDSRARQWLSEFKETLSATLSMHSPSDAAKLLGELQEECQNRQERTDADSCAPVFLFVRDLQKFKALRFEEDFGFSMSEEPAPPNPGQALRQLLQEGPLVGMHVILSADQHGTALRMLGRQGMECFSRRVLLQMSSADSNMLCESSAASNLGLHRALLYDEGAGSMETFRPYAIPDPEWLPELAQRHASVLSRQQEA